VTHAYYRGAVGACIVFDLTNIVSFEHVATWLKEVREGSDSEMVVMLIGNKSDLVEQRMVNQD
jgi:Ras-related protein Rab-11A